MTLKGLSIAKHDCPACKVTEGEFHYLTCPLPVVYDTRRSIRTGIKRALFYMPMLTVALALLVAAILYVFLNPLDLGVVSNAFIVMGVGLLWLLPCAVFEYRAIEGEDQDAPRYRITRSYGHR